MSYTCQPGPGVTVIHGNCLDELRKLPAESVHCCVTSPPYWGLRDYGIAPSVWSSGFTRPEGGQPECEHDFSVAMVRNKESDVANEKRKWQHDKGNGTHTREAIGEAWQPKTGQGAFCAKCGAWRGCFGLEPTPELYVAHAVLIFREVRRVLRKDGTLWVNLGDSFCSTGTATNRGNRRPAMNGHGQPQEVPDFSHPVSSYSRTRAGNHCDPKRGTGATGQPHKNCVEGRKTGDLVGIPWMVAFALQADGWWLRRDNIWHKPAPMPESVNGWRWEQCRGKAEGRRMKDEEASASRVGPEVVPPTPDPSSSSFILLPSALPACPGCAKCTPHGGFVLRKGNWRCTTAHEYVFQFSKSASYFCDAEAAKEGVTGGAHARGTGVNPKAVGMPHNGSRQNASFSGAVNQLVTGRNRRSVWRVNTKPFAGAHFATFPPGLIEPIIRAATPVACCAECGAPWAPVVERGSPDLAHQRACGGDKNGQYHGHNTKDYQKHRAQPASTVKERVLAGMVEKRVTGYRATCKCKAEGRRMKDEEGYGKAAGVGIPPELTSHSSFILHPSSFPPGAAPAVVLDPFLGSGTTAAVALELGREGWGIEVAAHYLPLIQARLEASRASLLRRSAPAKASGRKNRPVASQQELFSGGEHA